MLLLFPLHVHIHCHVLPFSLCSILTMLQELSPEVFRTPRRRCRDGCVDEIVIYTAAPQGDAEGWTKLASEIPGVNS